MKAKHVLTILVGAALVRLTGFAPLQFAAAFVGAIAGGLMFGLS